jgi:hypothetical protein
VRPRAFPFGALKWRSGCSDGGFHCQRTDGRHCSGAEKAETEDTGVLLSGIEVGLLSSVKKRYRDLRAFLVDLLEKIASCNVIP